MGFGTLGLPGRNRRCIQSITDAVIISNASLFRPGRAYPVMTLAAIN